MIAVQIKLAGRKNVYQVIYSWAYDDKLAYEHNVPVTSYGTLGIAMLTKFGGGKKPQPGSCINARKFLGI